MTYIKQFTEITKTDAAIAGEKGASLGEMTQNNIPVPPGFVVVSNAFDVFIKETNLFVEIDAALDKVSTDAMHTIELASKKIQTMILAKEMPENISKEILHNFTQLNSEFVAVRSSATAEDSVSAAWAGQLDTFLNTTKDTLLENVKKCWASLFTPRAIFYRFEKKLNKDHISVAVVIQTMVQSETSGVIFSVHPVTEDYNHIIIEAGFGLGEAIVSGQVTPDSYVVDKQGFEILDITVQDQQKGLFKNNTEGNEWKGLGEDGKNQVLSGKDIITLAKYAVQIENHYGFPCDIEWAKEGDNFYITQSRVITTLKVMKDSDVYASGLIKENAEVSYDEFVKKYQKEEWTKVGSWRIPRIAFDTFYCSQSTYYLNKYGITNIPPIKYLQVGNDVFVAKKELALVKESIFSLVDGEDYEFIYKFDKMQALYRKNLEDELNLLESVSEIDKELVSSILEKTCTLLVVFEILRDVSSFFEEAIMKRFKELGVDPVPLPELLDKERESDTYKLNQEVVTFAQKGLVPTKSEMETIIKRYGYLKQYFLSGNTYTKKDILEQIEGVEEKEEIRNKETFNDDKLNSLVALMNRFSAVRLLNNEITNKAFFKLKESFQLLAKKSNVSYEKVLALPLKECVKLLNGEEQELDKGLLGNGVAVISVDKNYILPSAELDRFKNDFLQKDYSGQKELKGTPTYRGFVRGVVKIVMSANEFPKLIEGDILVCSMTDPNYVPVMKKSSAIITDIGGILCHAAIVSREMQKPCIIGTKIATQVLQDGDLVEVNANTGVVKILDKTK